MHRAPSGCLQSGPLGCQCLLLVLLLGSLVLNVDGLLGLVDLGVSRELIIFLLGRGSDTTTSGVSAHYLVWPYAL